MKRHEVRPGSRRDREVAIAWVAVGLFATAGCASAMNSIHSMPGMGKLDTRPGLADVRVLGPKGQKCYDFCAQSEVSCKHMCPSGTVGECKDDCVTDTKGCLADCPELERPEPPLEK